MSYMNPPPTPYPPPAKSEVQHIALASKAFRVFGLKDPAWKTAREAWKKVGGQRQQSAALSEEEDEMQQISRAVHLALSPDAGGFGTAGFHKSRVEDVQLAGSNEAAWNALLIPCHADSGEELDAELVALGEQGGCEGNDERFVHAGPFGVRVTVARASEALLAKAVYEQQFLRAKLKAKNGAADSRREDDADEERLLQLMKKQRRLRDEEEPPLGYYVEIMLLEPAVTDIDPAVAPPAALDKCSPSVRPAQPADPSPDDDNHRRARSALDENLFASKQFLPPGPWERANLKAFDEMALDLRKALVRLEFPVFPEGCKNRTFREIYQLNARLKSGSFATVCRGTHRASGKKIAVKCVLRKDLPPNDDAAIYDEVLILSTLRHRYICPLIDFFEERECYFLVMELMSGGDLFDRIGKKKTYSEQDARDLCRKMLESVRYCHENSVAHCDMKPKNLLLVNDDDDVQIKLADFGFATRVYEPNSLTKQCGTPFFVAPEVLMRSPYDQQSDMWSVGVIVFLLLGGDLPFMGKSQKELFRKIVIGKYEFPEESWSHVSEEGKDLVRKLLVTDPSQRLTSRQAMASSWIRQRGQLLAKNNLEYTSQRLKTFNARMKLRSAFIAVDWVTSTRLSIARMRSERSSVAENEEGEETEKGEAQDP